MQSPPIVVDRVWKRYRLGSKHDSLRDAIPAMLKRLTGRNGHSVGKDEFWALKDVSFHVNRAETLGIIGPNGAGKSTILKLLSRICRETKGNIRLQGRLAALIEVGAGFHPDLTGRENVYLNGTIMGMRRREIDRLFDSIVAFSELEKFLEMPIKRYSSGMTVRLGFAVAAHVNPEILLIDEVLAVGDLAFQQKCYQRILDLKASGTTMIFISHNLEAVQRLCDRVVLLHWGEVDRDGDPSEVLLRYRQEVLRQEQLKPFTLHGQDIIDPSQDIDITRARLLDAEGKPTDMLSTGDSMSLELAYALKRPIAEPSVTVTLERLDGLICHEASTRTAALAWSVWDKPGVLRLEYPAVNLLPNTYQVIVSIYEGRNPVPLKQVKSQLYFHITSDHNTRGAVHLEHAWTLQPAD